MASFGFYFGFTFGLMRVLLNLVSLFAALLAAMFLTPIITNLLMELLALRVPYIPFVAFITCLIMVFMMAKILHKLIEETVEEKKFNRLSQLLGGGFMALVFTLFYAVLVSFFGAAGLVQLVYNKDQLISEAKGPVQLYVPRESDNQEDTITLLTAKQGQIFHFTAALRLGFRSTANHTKAAYLRTTDSLFYLSPNQAYRFKSPKSMQLFQTNSKELCSFCTQDYIVICKGEGLYFECTDKSTKSIRVQSLLYPYIQKVPEVAAQLLEGLLPVVDDFIDFMRIAVAKLNQDGH